MTMVNAYQEFAGRHPETGTIRNLLAYQGVTAPHTGEPLSEALLLGISGGITVGYFTFEYKGYPPHIALLTRNTFDPMETIFERLAIPRDTLHTTSNQKAEANLCDALDSDQPAITWVDFFSLPYNNLPYDERNWRVQPVVVYGLDNGKAYLADRASVPVVVTADELRSARERIKKYKFRIMTLGQPDMERLPVAVEKGIRQCIRLYTDAPPKGKRESFGLAALQHWAKMLTNTRNKQSWIRYFPPGERLWMALAGNATQPGVFSWIDKGTGNTAERGMYADFLDEAAVILDKSALQNTAQRFRSAEAEWATLARMILPQDVPVFQQVSELLTQKRASFIANGAEAIDEIRQINSRLSEIQQAVTADFTMSDDDVIIFFEQLAAQVTTIRDIEQDAITHLQSTMT